MDSLACRFERDEAMYESDRWIKGVCEDEGEEDEGYDDDDTASLVPRWPAEMMSGDRGGDARVRRSGGIAVCLCRYL